MTPHNREEQLRSSAAKIHPAKDYPIPAQRARYYLCRGGACAQPVDGISELAALFAPDN